MKGYLVLKSGEIFEGHWLGDARPSGGEIVFNTSMTGYQEVLTDPSYHGQVVVMTYPLIGNYGVHVGFSQSTGIKASGLIVAECFDTPNHWQSAMSLEAYLKHWGVPGLAGVDTRALTKCLRTAGTSLGCLVTDLTEAAAYLETMEQNLQQRHPVFEVTTAFAYELQTTEAPKAKVAVMDFGIKSGILASMLGRGFELKVFPAWTSAEDVLAWGPDGVFLSNGPGDPSALDTVIHNVGKLAEVKPTFGICLGHQLLCHAFGGQTEKLKFGHRGANHPVKDIGHNRVYMTAQNHGYVVVEASLDLNQWRVSHYNVNDKSIEGLKHEYLPVFSVQYHPEASPGPSDSLYLFDDFLNLMAQEKGGDICA